jgi:hypothetical protein
MKTFLLLSGILVAIILLSLVLMGTSKALVTSKGTIIPDEDCLYDTSLSKCTPGPEGCPEGFGTNDKGQCFPLHDKCPTGYHSHEDDESGECIPDSTPCEEGYIMNLSYASCERKEFVSQGKGN